MKEYNKHIISATLIQVANTYCNILVILSRGPVTMKSTLKRNNINDQTIKEKNIISMH